MDELYLGPVPCDEDCAQVGSDDYYNRSRKECNVFINQLIRQFGQPPENTRFKIKSNPHDFGTYHEVVVIFDEQDDKSIDYAFNVEKSANTEWDDLARTELGMI